MALWRSNMALTEKEIHKRREERLIEEKNSIIQTNYAYGCTPKIKKRVKTIDGKFMLVELPYRPNERIECADNRRAAGIYVKNF